MIRALRIIAVIVMLADARRSAQAAPVLDDAVRVGG